MDMKDGAVGPEAAMGTDVEGSVKGMEGNIAAPGTGPDEATAIP
jgi:hypothetical protein